MFRLSHLLIRSSRTHTCSIVLQPGLLNHLPSMLARRHKGRHLYVVTDSTVGALYGRGLCRAMHEERIAPLMIDVPPGERSKSAAAVQKLYSRLLDAGIRRDSLILALGGGVVGDVAGFVAATILRGVEYVQVPTTLLAQVDSAIGGKVGMNHSRGKNLIGAFYPPSAVYIDPAVLRTLSPLEFRNGLAEVVKVAFALDSHFFSRIERHTARLLKADVGLLAPLIHHAVALKTKVVRQDEKEGGLRKVLNFGHTIGHALESSTHYTMPHGEAVAIGMAAESRIAMEMGMLSRDQYARLLALLRALRLPVRFPRAVNRTKFLRALLVDKKGDASGVRFVLPKSPGLMLIGVNVPEPFIQRLLTGT